MPDAAYYRAWRAAHPDYRKRNAERLARRRKSLTPEQRRKERGVRRPVQRPEPLPPLYPSLQHGTAVSFWEDELRLDLAQEAWLAALEGADPQTAVTAYRRRELAWRHHTCPFLVDGDTHEP